MIIKYGQLGLGDNENRNIPTQISNIKAKNISCGDYHTMIILSITSQFPANVHLISFTQVVQKLSWRFYKI